MARKSRPAFLLPYLRRNYCEREEIEIASRLNDTNIEQGDFRDKWRYSSAALMSC